ncbi:MAG: putative DNA binding domain-containing protein [Oscillospiraceae bacterium]|nr:putative DNA binding domain-containing protein [Oscillospiraceae bacterium]
MFFFVDNNDPNAELLQILNDLMFRWESEVVEFKEANNDYDKGKIGKYFSAISNEANLKGLQFGWLIFGVRNKDRKVVGSDYRSTKGLDALKYEISQSTTGGISFIEIFEVYPVVDGDKKRVVMFQIPSAATAIPTGWNGHYYGRYGESLGALSVEELDRIRGQEKKDWSRQIVEGATINSLDENAITVAREEYKRRMNKQHISDETDAMTDMEFLVKHKLIINGKVTNAAMILLGNGDYDYLLNSPPQIMWRLYGSDGNDKGYEIFCIPFITEAEQVFKQIRNLPYRYMPSQTSLFPADTQQYDTWILRELLNNCIAHADYKVGNRIYVNEFEDKIKFTNPGTFLPGTIEPVLNVSYNPPFYRNQLLAEAMYKFYMIDTASMGIRKVFRIQRDKFFPMPDYDLSTQNQVSVEVYGKVIDENYSRLLFNNREFDLSTVYLIDRIQKREPITKEAVTYLRKLGVIEGRLPNVYISAIVAEGKDEKAQYIKNKGLDEAYYRQLIIDYITQFGKASRADIRKLLFSKLPDVLSNEQKENKIKNILKVMSKNGVIQRDSDNLRTSNWIIT